MSRLLASEYPLAMRGFIPAIALSLVALPLTAQAPPAESADPVVIAQTITIRSEIQGEDRRVHVQLPHGYEADPESRYAVVYVLDGDAPGPFAYVAGLVGFLASGYQLPPMSRPRGRWSTSGAGIPAHSYSSSSAAYAKAMRAGRVYSVRDLYAEVGVTPTW